MRVVLNTNILIRANPKARGPAREVLQKIVSGEHLLITSRFLLQEVARVLAYPRVGMRWKLRPREIEEYLQILASVSEAVAPPSGRAIVLKDVDDDPIIYTAVAGRADVLCTLDAHFYEESVRSFCAQKGIKIMDDVELLRLIRSS